MRPSFTFLAPLATALALLGCVGADAQRPVPASGTSGGVSAPKAPDAPRTPGAPTQAFDSNRAWEHLRRQVAFGPRPVNSAALVETRRYIVEQLKAAGIETREQRFEADTPIGRVPMVNLIATIKGSRPERIALSTHYETKLSREFRFVGASDPAASVAAVLELGRVLAARQNAYTIDLLFFDGEEAINRDWQDPDNTYGSRYYVDAARKDGTLSSLKALVLLDLVGDRNLTIRREAHSTDWLVEIVWEAARRLGYSGYFLPEDTQAIADDHLAFLRAGVPAVDLIDLEYPAWHTPQDDLNAVSARSLQIVGDVVLEALPSIEKQLAAGRR